MQIKKLIVWHIAGWTFMFCFFITPVVFVGLSNNLFHIILLSVIYIIVFYVNLLFILPAWIKQRKIVKLLSQWLLVIIGCTSITTLSGHSLHTFHTNDDFFLEAWNALICNCLFVTFFLIASTAYRSVMDWFLSEENKHRLVNIRLNNELAFLKSQASPQFLFNTLNNIYIIAYREKAAKASEAVFKLSEMMKYLVYDGTNEKVPVAREIHYINQLMDLQQMKMTEYMSFRFDINGDMDNHTIAPLLLVPFFENICKHAVLTDTPDPVKITLAIKNGTLYFSSRNKTWQAEKDTVGGVGLLNVKTRLELLYPGKYDFAVSDNGVHYTVFLSVQLK